MSSNGENSVNLRYTVEEWIRLTWRDRLSGDGEMMEMVSRKTCHEDRCMMGLQAMLEKKAVMSRKWGRLVGFLYLWRQCLVSHEV